MASNKSNDCDKGGNSSSSSSGGAENHRRNETKLVQSKLDRFKFGSKKAHTESELSVPHINPANINCEKRVNLENHSDVANPPTVSPYFQINQKSMSGLRACISDSDSDCSEQQSDSDGPTNGSKIATSGGKFLKSTIRFQDSDSDNDSVTSSSKSVRSTSEVEIDRNPAGQSSCNSTAVSGQSSGSDRPAGNTASSLIHNGQIRNVDSKTNIGGAARKDANASINAEKKSPVSKKVASKIKDSDVSESVSKVSADPVTAVSDRAKADATRSEALPGRGRDNSTTDSLTPMATANRKRNVTIIASSDSEDERPNVSDRNGHAVDATSGQPTVDAMEKRLGVLCHIFPEYDQMEHQDLLVKNNWNVKVSLEQIRQKEAAQKRANLVPTVKRRRIQVAADSSDDDSDCTSRWKSNGKAPGTAVAPSDASTSSKKEPLVARPGGQRERGEKKKKKHSKRDADSGEEEAYDSDAGPLYDSEDSDVDDRPTHSRTIVIDFFNQATLDELIAVPGCSRKKAEVLIELRPYTGWLNLISKMQNGRAIGTDLINGARNCLKSRRVVNKLMQNCESIADRMGERVARLLAGDSSEASLKEQPSMLSEGFTLAPYQLLGINWLVLMDNERLNGILADEMGLGKTIQTVAFLASRWEEGDRGPHLVVTPASTIDNWEREIGTWCPALRVILYQGSQEERRTLRLKILSGRESNFHIMLATYNMIAGNSDDRSIFKKIKFKYVIFDEAHLLKNMASQRYQHLVKIRAERRLLLTGTPLQNNLVELMSLLVFVMPKMFDGKVDHLKAIFAIISKDTSDDMKGTYERDRIEHAKRIMKPFVLRRLKSEVLQQLPKKKEQLIRCPMTDSQRRHYETLIASFSKQIREHKENLQPGSSSGGGSGMMMQLRRLANHPLLMRYHYDDVKLRKMSQLMLKEPTHENANPQLVFEDMQVMSDFELQRLCAQYKSLSKYMLDSKYILHSGKFEEMSRLLPEMKAKGDRVLLFSQFVIVLDIVEKYMKMCNHKYLRLDGSTPIHDRQVMIDQYTKDDSIFLFMLSTKAGGLGINLTAANTVILHDIDFNPYNDKQAEDRCHRVGQTKTVKIIRLISKDTIEEGIYKAAEQKLKLERDVTSTDRDESGEDSINVASLLKVALGV